MLICENVRPGWASPPKRELAGLPKGLKLRGKNISFVFQTKNMLTHEEVSVMETMNMHQTTQARKMLSAKNAILYVVSFSVAEETLDEGKLSVWGLRGKITPEEKPYSTDYATY